MKLASLPAWLRVALAAFLLAAMVWFADWRAVADAAANADTAWLAAGLGCAVAGTVASAWRWRALAAWMGLPVGHAWAQLTYLRAMAINALLPGAVVGGDVYRALALQRVGQLALEARTSVVLDRLSGLWMLFVLAALAAGWGLAMGGDAWTTGLGWMQVTAGVAVAAGLLLLIVPMLVMQVIRARSREARPEAHWFARLTALSRRPALSSQMMFQVVASAIVQAFSIAALACAGHALGIAQPYWVYAVAAAPTFLMAALPVGIGGWGTREAAAAVSLGVFGVQAADAVAASMFFGLFALIQAMAGALSLATQSGARRAPH